MFDHEHTLFINRSDSRCGNCRGSANPYESHHFTRLGYGPTNGTPGCQVEWMYVSSDYDGDSMKRACIEMRPDLVWVI